MAAAASAAAAVRGGEGDREAYVGVRGLKSKVRERVEGARKREKERETVAFASTIKTLLQSSFSKKFASLAFYSPYFDITISTTTTTTVAAFASFLALARLSPLPNPASGK